MNQLAITNPSMTVAKKHKKALSAYVHDTGRIEAQEVNAKTELMPKEDAHAVIGELTAALEPASDPDALVCAKLLIGCYRIKDVVDADIYIQTMAKKFAKFPADISRRIVDEITDKQVFPPSPAEVVTEGSNMVRMRECALYTARKHLDERERRRKYFEEKDRLKGDAGNRETHLKGLYEESGLEWPGFEKASYTDVADKITQPNLEMNGDKP